MWRQSFQDRLLDWNRLRDSVKQKSLTNSLTSINQYWFKSPWRPYYLHWDDRAIWPDPWQLLNENVFCDVARGLGIMYTIAFSEHQEITDAKLVLTSEGHTLVLVEPNKHILNWEPNQVLNKKLNTKYSQVVTLRDIKNKF